MGTVESCCGKREVSTIPSMPSRPLSALGNRKVTFQSEQQDTFLVEKGVWVSDQSFEAMDINRSPWFRIEGKSTKTTHEKKLVLNNGDVHAKIHRKGRLWHIYMENERRVTINREVSSTTNGSLQTHWFNMFLHRPPYPGRESPERTGASEPVLTVHGDFSGGDFWFAETESRETKKVAYVESASNGFYVRLAANVDIALILVSVMIVDACINHDVDFDVGGENTERSVIGSTAGFSSTADDWKPQRQSENAQILPNNSSGQVGVPPLWRKGKTPRNV